ncbi:MAG TPA: DEAD/DEAH box helicase [Actinocrinis sp.]|uniref:DEAD/DEAH box helicase n=1 Tax=Actinocrinis sp. TaxID=1920516 RepID=UPI002DDD0B59|nr:DEAD/DEAH box helicase [Actinocrinis sp.]HEV2345498.1 DEAD/DEAH box helicase [Actinocrinis sp.]
MTGEPAAAGDAFAALNPVIAHHIVNTLGWRALRPLQEAAIEPLLAGRDAVLLAPTAGGKTEAACFPLLSAMETGQRRGASILYLCPIKALLNNLEARIGTYAGWIGRRAALWHGDIGAGARRAMLREAPDVLLTTPESLEAMLVSVNVDHRALFGNVYAVVVDEVHAFAGDDRGWHLLALLERLSRIVGRPIQRIGLSATVGNPNELLHWLQGSGAGIRPGSVIAPDLPGPAASPGFRGSAGAPPGDIELDYVGSVENAALVISSLHKGEKRLVFCDSRRQVEQLGEALRAREVTTFLSHASLSADERRRSEAAFADARDCVIVATSTLELGIDVGDLDRVIQIDAPGTVASFLQRLGRTGRRPGAVRNCLFLATTDDALLRAAGLLLLWGQGWVEPVVPPPAPLHLVAQQLLACCLQHGTVGDRLWQLEWNGLPPFDVSAQPILDYLRRAGFVDADGGRLFIGAEAEKHFGRRHFMELTASFTAPPQFTVFAGRTELGQVDPALLTEQTDQPRRLLLAGRSWQVTHIDFAQRRCYVEAVEAGGRAKWASGGLAAGLSMSLTRAMRDVVVADNPPVKLTRRAVAALIDIRADRAGHVFPGGTVVARTDDGPRWWTWGGFRVNLTLSAIMRDVAPEVLSVDSTPTDQSLQLADDLSPAAWHEALVAARASLPKLPTPDDRAIRGLKFSAALPDDLARMVLSARLADTAGASAVLAEPVRWESDH